MTDFEREFAVLDTADRYHEACLRVQAEWVALLATKPGYDERKAASGAYNAACAAARVLRAELITLASRGVREVGL